MADLAGQYPKQCALEDGAPISLSLMSPDDRDALTKFIERLHRHDLAYLQIDITQPRVIDVWMENIGVGLATSICAYDPASLVGYASLQRKTATDTEGEIRVNVSEGYRSRGLGRVLIDEVFEVAQRLDLQRVTARMTTDQYGAQSAFKRLGFSQETILENHIKDSAGTSRDLIVMAHQF